MILNKSIKFQMVIYVFFQLLKKHFKKFNYYDKMTLITNKCNKNNTIINLQLTKCILKIRQTISSRSSLPETIKLKTYDKLKEYLFYRNLSICDRDAMCNFIFADRPVFKKYIIVLTPLHQSFVKKFFVYSKLV